MAATRKLDPEATRAAIVAAATELFVEHGPNGASMSDIARRAGVTKSLIHHHFGSKDELWAAVKLAGIQPYLDWQRELLESRGPDETLLTDSVIWYFKFLQANPAVVRLMVWMAIEPPAVGERDDDLITLGVARLEQGQREGLIRADVDPRSVIVGFLSLCEHFFQYRHVMGCGRNGCEDQPADAAADAYLDAIVKVMARGLRPEEE
ncbi:MAG: helix-turn-helix transcriptional regulator [Myxococcales bacterium]|nr:helix-turn-helix transcriptional regulator [Myxococcales bacterium]